MLSLLIYVKFMNKFCKICKQNFGIYMDKQIMKFENVFFFLNKLGCGSELVKKFKLWLESLKVF